VCPTQLGKLLQGNYNAIKALGAEVITISHEPIDVNKRLAQQHKLEFPSLSDPARSTIKAYDAVDGAINIAQITFFVIDKEGVIRWRSRVFSNWNPDDLPPINVLLDAIQQAQ